ncbi:hypothetical protein CCACVL1_08060 [Corchorus capsularis]|uniref:Uncharacterized protein n=1 Tax=Corchorus capsularis TaxID=210143 RepID=A0A1R3J2G9_COCAP|nr:hypothetical protein CCACVL1_08060 [Corchorus capsularis]
MVTKAAAPPTPPPPPPPLRGLPELPSSPQAKTTIEIIDMEKTIIQSNKRPPEPPRVTASSPGITNSLAINFADQFISYPALSI